MSISYADRGGAVGYQVRVTRNGKQYAKFFNSKKRGAKKRAQEYEQKLLKMLGPAKTTRGEKRSGRTNTGIRYISEATGKYGTDCFRVTFREASGKWSSRDVSIDFHGRTKALKMARKIHRDRHVPAKKEKAAKRPSPKTVKGMLESTS